MKKEIDSKEILNERFSQLPEVIQDIILQSNWKDVIRRLTNTYNLHIDQGGSLEAITLLTMLGLEDPKDYINNLKEEVKVTDSLAKEIAKEIENNVFQKIRESVMRETTGEKEGGVEIIEEKPEVDLYREQVDNIDIINKHHNEKVEQMKQDNKDIAANVDIIDQQKNKKGDEIVDREDILKEIEGAETNKPVTELPKANTELQSVIDAETSGSSISTAPKQPKKKIDPVHMRTLKGDIVRKKLENPSWVPKIAKKDVMSKQTKEIINDAEKTYLEKNPLEKKGDGVE